MLTEHSQKVTLYCKTLINTIIEKSAEQFVYLNTLELKKIETKIEIRSVL